MRRRANEIFPLAALPMSSFDSARGSRVTNRSNFSRVLLSRLCPYARLK